MIFLFFFPTDKKGMFWRTGFKFRSHGSLKKWFKINKITFNKDERSIAITKKNKMLKQKIHNKHDNTVQRGRRLWWITSKT